MNFREIYKRIRGYKIDKNLKNSLKGFPNYKEANCIIGYGYIDNNAGFTVEVLCLSKITDKGMVVFNGNDAEFKVRMDTSEIEGYYGDDILEKDLKKKYKNKIKEIDKYYTNKDLETIRKDSDLDEFRHPACLDDVIVHFDKDDLGTEQCWVRLQEDSEKGYRGILLNEPNQSFGIHEGDKVLVTSYIKSNGERYLRAMLNQTTNVQKANIFNKCYSFNKMDMVKEEYQVVDDALIANVSKDKILDVLNHFVVLNKNEKMFFILEVPANENKEIELNTKIAEELGESFNNFKMRTQHKDIYYIDMLDYEHILIIINENIKIFLNDGLISYGVGCHDTNDEIMIKPFNIITIFSRRIEKYNDFYKQHQIKKTKNIKTAWDLIDSSNTGKRQDLNNDGENVYSFIEKMKKEMGMYFAKTVAEE